jgi:hypothetical protein
MFNHVLCGKGCCINLPRIEMRLAGIFWIPVALLILASKAWGATEQTFDILQAGIHTYQHVTVTTKAKRYIFILHSGGMANVKVSDLSEDTLLKLGYELPSAPKPQPSRTPEWARQAVASPQVKQMQEKLSQAWQGAATRGNSYLPVVTPRLIAIVATASIAVYLFFCYCSMLICQKAGNDPGVMIWIPVLQMIPLLRAASMSRWWLVGFFIPIVNLIGHVVWCVKIVQARSKTTPLLILLLLPVTSLFAFVFLAFSEAAPKKKEPPPRVELMTLETA